MKLYKALILLVKTTFPKLFFIILQPIDIIDENEYIFLTFTTKFACVIINIYEYL